MEYRNKVAKRECPLCGMERPADWYQPFSPACWRCREAARPKRRGEAPAQPERRMR